MIGINPSSYDKRINFGQEKLKSTEIEIDQGFKILQKSIQ